MSSELDRFAERVIPYDDTRIVLYNSSWSDNNRVNDTWVPGIDVDAYPRLRDLYNEHVIKILTVPMQQMDSYKEYSDKVFDNVAKFFSRILKVDVKKITKGTVHGKHSLLVGKTPTEVAINAIDEIGRWQRDPMKVKYFIFYTNPSYETFEEAKSIAMNIADVCASINSGKLQSPV